MKSGRVWSVVFLTGVLMALGGCATSTPAEVSSLLGPTRRNSSGHVYACTVAVSELTSSAFYESVTVVGEHPSEDEWWVVYRDRASSEFIGIDGKEHAVNVPKWKVLFEGEHRIVKGVLCRCPGTGSVE